MTFGKHVLFSALLLSTCPLLAETHRGLHYRHIDDGRLFGYKIASLLL
ncbi:MAG: hypothetical protein ACREQX_14105 [Candidatus Binataceae bacterium]